MTTAGFAANDNELGGCAIFGTANGGKTWTKQYSLKPGQFPGEPHLWALDCASATHAWAVVEQGWNLPILVAATTNGTTWTAHDTGSTGYAEGIDFINGTHGWMSTTKYGPTVSSPYHGVVLATTDGGATWHPEVVGLDLQLNGIFFLDQDHGWVSTIEDTLVFRTTNGGATWQKCTAPTAFRRLCFTDANHGFATAAGTSTYPAIYTTSDGGKTWVGSYDVPSSIFAGYYLGIDFVDATHGWAAGALLATESGVDSGSILKYSGPASTDTKPPVTVAHGVSKGWVNHSVKLTFTATDNSGGSGVDYTEYSTNGGTSWAKGTSVTISTPGTTTVKYRSADKAGNVEAAKSCTVRIDTGIPSTSAKAATVKRNKKVTLKFAVTDPAPSCGKAKVTIKIMKGSKVLKTLAVGKQATNKSLTYKWKASLKKGSYTFQVLATDIAGNKATSVGSASLTVK